MYKKYMRNARACLFIFLRTRPGLASGAETTRSPIRWRLREARRTSTETALALASIQLRAHDVTVAHFEDEP